MFSKRTVDLALWGVIGGAVAAILLPTSLLFGLGLNRPNADTTREALIALGSAPLVAGETSDPPSSQNPTIQRLISVWKSGAIGGATILDAKGAPHSIKLGEAFGEYRLSRIDNSKAIFASPRGEETFHLSPLPRAPDLEAFANSTEGKNDAAQ